RATELLRADIGGETPIARLYDRLRRGENVAQAYSALTSRSFDDFVAGLGARMREGLPRGPAIVTVATAPEGAGASYLLYGFAPSPTAPLRCSGARPPATRPVNGSHATVSPVPPAAVLCRRCPG